MNKNAVILNDTSTALHHGCEVVMENIKKLLLKNDIKIIDTNPVDLNWRKNSNFIHNMNKADIVVVNGEGTLHHSQPTAMELVIVGKYVKESLGIPVVLINSTIQNNNSLFYDYLKYFDMVFVRETLSQDELLKHDIKSEVVPDMSFYSRFNLLNKRNGHKIGITDSVYLDFSEKMYNFSLENKYYFLPILTDIKFISYAPISALRIAKYFAIKIIKLLLNELNCTFKYKSKRVFFYSKSYNQYTQNIAKLSFLIVGRYHSLCFSLKTLTPFVAFKSNSFKIEGIMQDVGIKIGRIQEFNQLNIEEYREFTHSEVIKIKAYTDKAPCEIDQMFKKIYKLIV